MVIIAILLLVVLAAQYLLWQQNKAIQKQLAQQKRLDGNIDSDKSRISGVIYAD